MPSIEVGKTHSTGSHGIDVRGFDRRVTVAAQITVSLIIGHNEHEIRQVSGIPGTARGNRGQRQKYQRETGLHVVINLSVPESLT